MRPQAGQLSLNVPQLPMVKGRIAIRIYGGEPRKAHLVVFRPAPIQRGSNAKTTYDGSAFIINTHHMGHYNLNQLGTPGNRVRTELSALTMTV